MKKLIFVLILTTLGACSSPQDDFVGLWKKEGSTHRVIEIKFDNNYFLVEKTSAFSGQFLDESEEKTSPLIKKENYLELKTGYGSMPLMLSNKNNTLNFQSSAYSKINKKTFKLLKEKAKAKAEHDQLCNKITSKYYKSLGFSLIPNKEELEKMNQIQSVFNKKLLDNGCSPIN